MPGEYFETRETGVGEMRVVRHASCIEGVGVGWDVIVKPLGSEEKRWLEGGRVVDVFVGVGIIPVGVDGEVNK